MGGGGGGGGGCRGPSLASVATTNTNSSNELNQDNYAAAGHRLGEPDNEFFRSDDTHIALDIRLNCPAAGLETWMTSGEEKEECIEC